MLFTCPAGQEGLCEAGYVCELWSGRGCGLEAAPLRLGLSALKGKCLLGTRQGEMDVRENQCDCTFKKSI